MTRLKHEEANTKQVGGTHYNSAYQHWDWVEDTGMGYLEAQATKYITRWRKKDGRKDVEKALHYVEKLLERFDKHHRTNRIQIKGSAAAAKLDKLTERFCKENKLSPAEAEIAHIMANWDERNDLTRVQFMLISIIEGLTAKELEKA